jgi:four helix bundle protein
MASRYEDLLAWQKAMSLVTSTYVLSKTFPEDERFGLTSQMRRSAISIPSNIAEGQGRLSKKEFRQFLALARGSLFELETQMRLATTFSYVNESSLKEFLRQSGEVARLINGLIASLKERA